MIPTGDSEQDNKQPDDNGEFVLLSGTFPTATLPNFRGASTCFASSLRNRVGHGPSSSVAVIGIVIALHALSASAQTAREVKGATPLVAIQDEDPVKFIVDPPMPEQLALGRVFIQYRTENLRIMPVYGKAALAVSPRIGHLHYYVDDQSWPTVDSSGETVVLVGLAPGSHKVRLELADTIHRPIPGCSKVVEFIIPTLQK